MFIKKKSSIFKYIIVIFTLLILFNFLGRFLGAGFSFPPNRCDLSFGYELERGHLLLLKKDLCLEKLASEKRDQSYCNGISHDYGKRDCKKDVAVLKQDPNLCFGIEIPSAGNDRYIYRCIVESTNNKSLCETHIKRIFQGKVWNDFIGTFSEAVSTCVNE